MLARTRSPSVLGSLVGGHQRGIPEDRDPLVGLIRSLLELGDEPTHRMTDTDQFHRRDGFQARCEVPGSCTGLDLARHPVDDRR